MHWEWLYCSTATPTASIKLGRLFGLFGGVQRRSGRSRTPLNTYILEDVPSRELSPSSYLQNVISASFLIPAPISFVQGKKTQPVCLSPWRGVEPRSRAAR